MDEYKKYLAENILSEDKVITYRVLSRALNSHVNAAKQMLYDFHKWQNGKRPGSVYATYLVYGTKKDEHGSSQPQRSQDGDVDMMSSAPEPDEEEDVVPVQTLSLIPEDELKGALEAYEDVASIHIYSLGPQPVKDMALLADAARQIATLSTTGDPSTNAKLYGTIISPNVRRRERRGPGAKLAAAAPAVSKASASVVPTPKVEAKPTTKSAAAAPAKAKEEGKEEKAPTPPASSTSTASVNSKKAKPTLQRGGSSGLMAAFAKGVATKAKKAESQPATPSGDDSSVHPLSEDEDEDEDDSAVLPKPMTQQGAEGKSRAQQRKEELQRMMEQDDDEAEETKTKEDTPMEEPEEEPPAPEPVKEEPAEIISASGDGRRRGKRKVMKPRRFLDEEGNMVTVREPVWEAFSEDEAPPPPASKPKPASSAPAATKGKKAAPKGQGSIMSFFGKKT